MCSSPGHQDDATKLAGKQKSDAGATTDIFCFYYYYSYYLCVCVATETELFQTPESLCANNGRCSDEILLTAAAETLL